MMGKCTASNTAITGPACDPEADIQENLKHLQLGLWTTDEFNTIISKFGQGSKIGIRRSQLATHLGTTIPGFMKHVSTQMNLQEVEVKKWPLNRPQGVEFESFVATESQSESLYDQQARRQSAMACTFGPQV